MDSFFDFFADAPGCLLGVADAELLLSFSFDGVLGGTRSAMTSTESFVFFSVTTCVSLHSSIIFSASSSSPVSLLRARLIFWLTSAWISKIFV